MVVSSHLNSAARKVKGKNASSQSEVLGIARSTPTARLRADAGRSVADKWQDVESEPGRVLALILEHGERRSLD